MLVQIQAGEGTIEGEGQWLFLATPLKLLTDPIMTSTEVGVRTHLSSKASVRYRRAVRPSGVVNLIAATDQREFGSFSEQRKGTHSASKPQNVPPASS